MKRISLGEFILKKKSLLKYLVRKFFFSFHDILTSFLNRLLIYIELKICARLIMFELRCFVIVKLIFTSMILVV